MLRFFGKGKALRAPISRTKAQHFFPKIGWGGGGGVRGRLEVFRKFIKFGPGSHPLAARARRGGSLAGRVRGNTRAILQRLMREDEEEVEEEENSDSDFSVSSDLGPILNVIL